MKTLKRCPAHDGGRGKVLPIASFHRDRTSLDGHQGLCKECLNERRRQRYARLGSSLNDLYAGLRARACRQGANFGLSLEEFKRLVAQPCVYGSAKRPEVNIGVDRKDPSGGYTSGNLVPCCPRHNKIKSDFFSFESMRKIVAEFDEAKECANVERKTSRKFHGRLIAPAIARLAASSSTNK